MDWLQCINKSISYIEEHLMDDLCVEDVSNQVFASKYNFQRMFHLVTGVTIGEYIRNRRLSLAGRELLHAESRVVDAAFKYHYETSESFSKAFSRFHGISPSDVKNSGVRLKFFSPLVVNISVQGGFSPTSPLIEEFCWSNMELQNGRELSAAEKYQSIVSWAAKARGQNPGVFDALIEWMLDDSGWSDEDLIENEQILIYGILARFKEQNARLWEFLLQLKPSGVVNEMVFKALSNFDDELSGKVPDKRLQNIVFRMLSDFSIMKERSIREQIAGSKTGPTGTGHADFRGYINYLKDCDAEVQWALFMPDKVRRQQKGLKVESFEYKKMPAVRFIGREAAILSDPDECKEIFHTLDVLSDCRSGFDYDILLTHHYGLSIDIGLPYYFWGRFMAADTPVPEGFLYFDFVPDNDGRKGTPYMSQFAFAVFRGYSEDLHKCEGYDRSAMYDITRNIMLGQGVKIPYPGKYWTAEVFLDGYEKSSTAYMFSAEQPVI